MASGTAAAQAEQTVAAAGWGEQMVAAGWGEQTADCTSRSIITRDGGVLWRRHVCVLICVWGVDVLSCCAYVCVGGVYGGCVWMVCFCESECGVDTALS